MTTDICVLVAPDDPQLLEVLAPALEQSPATVIQVHVGMPPKKRRDGPEKQGGAWQQSWGDSTDLWDVPNERWFD